MEMLTAWPLSAEWITLLAVRRGNRRMNLEHVRASRAFTQNDSAPGHGRSDSERREARDPETIHAPAAVMTD
jgi:hypothetical protein